MFLLVGAALALQIQISVGTPDCKGNRNVGITAGGDMRADSACTPAPRRIPVTPQHLATAFRDPAARSLLTNARVARLRRDSSIVSYEANAYQRLSAGLGFARV